MSDVQSCDDEALLEECIDELDAAFNTLERFPMFVIAFAVRAHLISLLRALTISGQIGDRELREFLAGLQSEAQGHHDADET